VPSQNQTGCAIERGTADLPLATLLSQTLVAFTIELDNEFEHGMPHRTTNHGSSFGPWLTSMAMYLNCMKFTGDEGVTVSELERLARTTTNLHGMQRWGYVVVEGGPDSKRSQSPNRRPVARPGRDWVVRPTLKGKMAREVWGPLFGVIEERWQARFGRDEIQRLREALSALLNQMDCELPECLPILGYGLFSRGSVRKPGGRVESDSALPPPLPVLLARVLLVFAIEFEGESEISLAIGANVLRVLDEQGVRVRDLPQLSGVSKEAISMAMGILGKKGLAVVETETGSRTKIARLTAEGIEAQDAYGRLLAKIEERWRERSGEKKICELRAALEVLAGEPGATVSPLFRALEPYPDGWRASVRRPEVLPHYPMVLHRGGFPDGS
jgi:DNA-binding MarR family transcriptional regulator